MNSRRLVILSCITVLFLTVRCDLTYPHLKFPEKSQTGANTFGCIVDGVVWTQFDNTSCFLCSNDPQDLFSRSHMTEQGLRQFSVTANYNIDWKHLSQNMSINIDDLTGPGRYELPDGALSYHFNNSNRTYSNVGPGSAVVTITNYTFNDSIQAIISGEFSGTVYSPETSRSIKIEDGRFDLTVLIY